MGQLEATEQMAGMGIFDQGQSKVVDIDDDINDRVADDKAMIVAPDRFLTAGVDQLANA